MHSSVTHAILVEIYKSTLEGGVEFLIYFEGGQLATAHLLDVCATA